MSRRDELSKVLKDLSSKFKNTPINFYPEMAETNVETVSSGSLILDSILGGGIAKGRIIEIYGAESSGKTSTALTVAANVQKEGGTAVFLDLEHALDPRYAQKLGVNMQDLVIAQPSVAEETLEMIKDLAESGKVDLIIVDSVASMVPRVETDQEFEKSTIGLVARLLSKALKQIISIAYKNKCTIIFLNQTRANVGVMYGPATTTTGGNALKFYASQRIEVKRKGKVEDENKDIVGNEVLLKVVKNKIAPPFGEGLTVLTYNHGINQVAELQVLGEELGVIAKEGRTFFYNGDTSNLDLSQGNAELVEEGKVKIAVNTKPALKELENNTPLREVITKDVLHKLAVKNGFVTEDVLPS